MTVILVLGVGSVSFAGDGAGSWFEISLGVNGMAMNDFNETDFRWHEDSPDGFDMDELNSGTALAFGFGYDMSPALSYGVFWEHQYASSEGDDLGMEADMNLAADIFLGRLEYKIFRAEKWTLGVAGSLGFLAMNGHVEIKTDGASYGKNDLSGSTWALEGMGAFEYEIKSGTFLQITGGYRQADVSSFDYRGSPVRKDDGSDMSLDYSGYTARVGLKYHFGGY